MPFDLEFRPQFAHENSLCNRYVHPDEAEQLGHPRSNRKMNAR
jgi:hypothetical protein